MQSIHQWPDKVIWRTHQRAKRCSMRIDPKQQCVVVTLPIGVRPRAVHHWVEQQKALLWQQWQQASSLSWCIMDQAVQVKLHHLTTYDFQQGVMYCPKNASRDALEQMMAKRAVDWLMTECIAMEHLTGLKAARWVFSDPKTRWGSCSSLGRIMLSWRLILMPKQVRHYVMVHELCHLRFMDHSPAFWGLVSRFYPDHQQARRWLKQHGRAVWTIHYDL